MSYNTYQIKYLDVKFRQFFCIYILIFVDGHIVCPSLGRPKADWCKYIHSSECYHESTRIECCQECADFRLNKPGMGTLKLSINT